ncbi:NAD(P)-dependent oxidoreductase [Aliarcobacter cryaerophilus]|uniref:NAD(P)-dependent oxidoreductase n=1 Tax=Aliarcobacter cryaerophilus TaxID=28198 RepID=UPI003DA6C94E
MNNFLNQLKQNIETMKSENIKSVFTIATTSKQEDEPYLTPIRKSDFFVVCGCVIFNQSSLMKIIEIIDGTVNYIFVDSEKKIPLKIHQELNNIKDEIYNQANTCGLVETGNLSKICFQKIKKSKIFEYKPNDITVNATWSFLSQRLHFLSGKKISILGSGNIGSKLALKLVESGSNVNIHRQNSYKGYGIAQGLNFIKPENTVSGIVFHENILQATFMSDVLIGATNGTSIIDVDLIKSIKKNAIIVDLGKNTLTKSAIKYALENHIEIYRTDVTAAFEGFIYEAIKMDKILQQSYGKRDLGYCTIVGGGYFGANGDIVVDNISNPSRIFGVAAGDGTMKKELSYEDKEKINQLKEDI